MCPSASPRHLSSESVSLVFLPSRGPSSPSHPLDPTRPDPLETEMAWRQLSRLAPPSALTAAAAATALAALAPPLPPPCLRRDEALGLAARCDAAAAPDASSLKKRMAAVESQLLRTFAASARSSHAGRSPPTCKVMLRGDSVIVRLMACRRPDAFELFEAARAWSRGSDHSSSSGGAGIAQYAAGHQSL